MKRIAGLVLAAGIFLAACTPGKVIIQPSTSIKAYGGLDVEITSQSFLATMQGKKNYDNYVALCAEAEKQLGGHVKNWAATKWQGTAGRRHLTVKLELQEYNTGSGAAKFFLGSVANGHIVYLVTLMDGSKTIGQFLHEGQVDLMGNSAAFWNMAKQIEARIAATE